MNRAIYAPTIGKEAITASAADAEPCRGRIEKNFSPEAVLKASSDSVIREPVPSYWTQDWGEIRKGIIQRDKNTCQSCYRHLSSSALSVHHIIPRDEGGGSNPDNLIALCNKCHDIIEGDREIRIREQIVGFLAEPEKMKQRALESKMRAHKEMMDRVDADRPYWHARVYGGDKDTTPSREQPREVNKCDVCGQPARGEFPNLVLCDECKKFWSTGG